MYTSCFLVFFFLLPIWIQSGNKIPFLTRLLRAAEFQFVLALSAECLRCIEILLSPPGQKQSKHIIVGISVQALWCDCCFKSTPHSQWRGVLIKPRVFLLKFCSENLLPFSFKWNSRCCEKERSENTVNHNNHLRPLPDETMPHKSYRLGTPCAPDHLSSQHKEVSLRFSDENMTIYESQRDWVIAVSPSLLGMDEARGKYTGRLWRKGLNS